MIKYDFREMIGFEENKNGMTTNNALKKQISFEKKEEIKKLKEFLEEEYNKKHKKLKEVKQKYYDLIKKYNEEYVFNYSPMNLTTEVWKYIY